MSAAASASELTAVRVRRELGVAILVAAACAALGIAVVVAPAMTLLAPLGFLWAAILANWRRGVVLLVLFLPFAGVPSFLLGTPYAPVLKDIAIVLPLYLGLAALAGERERGVAPCHRQTLVLMSLLSILVVAYVAAGPSALAGAIGAKVWLAYLPLFVVGMRYVQSEADYVRIVRLVALGGIAPALLAFAEWLVYVRTGGLGPFLDLYGPVAPALEREVAFVHQIPRIPSTFTAATGYYNLSLAALAAALATWHVRRRPAWAFVVVLLALGALTSGLRRSYIFVPLLLLVTFVLSRPDLSTRVRGLLGAGTVLVVLRALGVDLISLAQNLGAYSIVVFNENVAGDFAAAVGDGILGGGTGSGTNAALRYGGIGIEEGWRESWYAKALVEFGIVGLALVLLLIGSVLRGAYHDFRRLPAGLREAAIPVFALLVVTAISLAKAAELDWDPMDAYFWLFAGLLAGLARAEPSERGGP